MKTKYITILLILLALVNSNAQGASDKQVLIDLYNATDGPNWTNNANWLSDLPLEKWTGVSTLFSSVTNISLSGNNLSGEIPTSIGDLESLMALDLSDNDLYGEIPSSIKDLSSFTSLNISENQYIFSDFETEHEYYETLSNSYDYEPQDLVDEIQTLSVEEGGNITLTSAVLTSDNNDYQWYKDNNLIEGATDKDLTINNVNVADAGTYHFIATNEVVTGLTLERNPITLKVEETIKSKSGITGSFRPAYEKKYVISGWVKENNSSNEQVITYANSSIRLSTVSVTDNALDDVILIKNCTPKGPIIDGWQRIEEVFVINEPNGGELIANNLMIDLLNSDTSGTITSYFDDIRIFPFNGSMKSFVYDNTSKKLMAELDENNYATFYEYDKEGGLVRVKKETTRGIYTIQETRSSNAKSGN